MTGLARLASSHVYATVLISSSPNEAGPCTRKAKALTSQSSGLDYQPRIMNRFRNRKRAKEPADTQGHGHPHPSIRQDAISPPSTKKGFRKKKIPTPEPKPEFDLASALPDRDDFRISLMMPNLSARFSMLREQDDPTTKIGKASDDSVLFPKRASRLNLFSHNPLADIAEVSSIRSSIKPRYVSDQRVHSLASDGYASDGASVQSRPRQGDGNNLFGGRQKLYRIPVGTSSSQTLRKSGSSEPDTGMRGRVVYEDDVSQSMFREMRKKELEEPPQPVESDPFLDTRSSVDAGDHEMTNSPSTGFSKKRGTTSSTGSAPSGKRISTAATSVESQTPALSQGNGSTSSLTGTKTAAASSAALERTTIIHRRLYGTPVDQPNSSHRAVKEVLDGSVRSRGITNDNQSYNLSPSKIATNLGEKHPRATPTNAFRTVSPATSATPPPSAPTDLGNRQGPTNGGEDAQACGLEAPLGPQVIENVGTITYTNSVQPEDWGKATALGLFNKPQQQYDELKFSERQKQMHVGRNSPLLTRGSSPRMDAEELSVVERKSDDFSSMPGAADPGARPSSRMSGADYHFERLSAESPVIDVQSTAAEAMETNSDADSTSAVPPIDEVVGSGTFFDSMPASDEEMEPSWQPEVPVTSRRQPSGVHPALRNGTNDFSFIDDVIPLNPTQDPPSARASGGSVSQTFHENSEAYETVPSQCDRVDADSPTLGPVGGLGLSGMIRTHLRHDSDKSSICTLVPTRLPTGASNESPYLASSSSSIVTARLANQPESVHSNPWEFDELQDEVSDTREAPDPMTAMSRKAQQILGQATALKNRANDKPQKLLVKDTLELDHEGSVNRPWQEELSSKHQRGGSTETQKEREDFNNELAERRRRVEERLKSVAEIESRSPSPHGPAERSPSRPVNAFSALRHKTGKTVLPFRQPEHQTKALKMLGIAHHSPATTSPGLPQDDMWKEEEEHMLRDFARRPRQPAPHSLQAAQNFSRLQFTDVNSLPSLSEEAESARQRSTTPSSSRSSESSRPRSRNGRYRDDLDKAMAGGSGTLAHGYEPSNAPLSIAVPSLPPVDERNTQPAERSASAMSGRYRSNSRQGPPSCFDSRSLTLGHGDSPPLSGATRPSPASGFSANSTPPILDSPETSPASTTGAYSAAAGHARRKRSVTKAMISEPTFLSSTSSVSLVGLPAGASLKNVLDYGDGSPPLVPEMNPRRRRQPTAQTLFGAFGRSERSESSPNLRTIPQSTGLPTVEERSTFSNDGHRQPPRQRSKLRKISSESGYMSSKARQQAVMAPSPIVPTFPIRTAPRMTMPLKIEEPMF